MTLDQNLALLDADLETCFRVLDLTENMDDDAADAVCELVGAMQTRCRKEVDAAALVIDGFDDDAVRDMAVTIQCVMRRLELFPTEERAVILRATRAFLDAFDTDPDVQLAA